jgi:Ca2+-binding EF-hand superfamily protein
MAKSRAAFEDNEGEEDPLKQEYSLDPLLEVLAKYKSSSDLSESIKLIYNRLDVDGSGGIGMTEMRDGLPQIISGIKFTGEVSSSL